MTPDIPQTSSCCPRLPAQITQIRITGDDAARSISAAQIGWVPQPVPSPARRKAVAWPMAARVARVSLSALSSMKSWMVPS
jgi:hypothetical protein